MIFHVVNCIEGFQDFQSCDFEGRSRHTGVFRSLLFDAAFVRWKIFVRFPSYFGTGVVSIPFLYSISSDLIWELHHYTEIPVVYPLSIFESWVLSQSGIVRFADSQFLIKQFYVGF